LLTLPPDVTNLMSLDLFLNPLTNLVLPEPLADTNLAELVQALRNQNIVVSTYALTIHFSPPRLLPGAFHMDITGPPGVYTILGSMDFVAWSEVAVETNLFGSIRLNDSITPLSQQKFYQARLNP